MLKFVEGGNPLISILKFLKAVNSCHKLKINLFVICCEKNKNYFSDSINYIFLTAYEVLM